jgi:hypothetical protein
MHPSHDAPSPPTGSLPTALSAVVERFEDAWQQAPPEPDLGAFLPTGEMRTRALVELAHVDLEYRLKVGQPARVEDYLGRFSELAGDGTALSCLIEAEYRLRVRCEPGLSAAEYLARFPQCREAILARLPPAAEQAATLNTSPPASPSSAPCCPRAPTSTRSGSSSTGVTASSTARPAST